MRRLCYLLVLMVNVAPADAHTTAPNALHSSSVRRSPRMIMPESAPTAGSRLISVPNVRAGIQVSASGNSIFAIDAPLCTEIIAMMIKKTGSRTDERSDEEDIKKTLKKSPHSAGLYY